MLSYSNMYPEFETRTFNIIQDFCVEEFLAMTSHNRFRRDGNKFTSMVLLMGSTGSGKSYFVNRLKEGATIESDSLYSCMNLLPLSGPN